MENYILISFLNDFVFCPRSIYFHQIYNIFDTGLYHEDVQTKGRIAHLNIDQKKYSTRKDMLQGIPVYSTAYSLCGRIDVFDRKRGILTERKKRIIKIYDGFIFQMYAQYYCLTEMGYNVKTLRIYSLDDNKNYFIPLPEHDIKMDRKFKTLLKEISGFDLEKEFDPNVSKCRSCIYRHLCDYGHYYAESA